MKKTADARIICRLKRPAKPWLIRGLLGCILLLCCCAPLAGSSEHLKVVFATGEWPPYSSKNLPHYGGAVALVAAISREAGIDPIFKFYPWKRAEMQVLKGEAFAAFPYAVSSERRSDFDFSDVLFHGLNVLLYHQNNDRLPDNFSYSKPSDLLGYRVGGISGSFLKSDLREAGVEYESTTSIDQSIQKLAAGRLDFCIDDKVVLIDAINRLYPDDTDKFRFVPEPFGMRKPTAMIISRSYPEADQILKRFNSALQSIRATGEYDRIINTYLINR